MITVEILRSREEFAAIRDAWTQLRSEHPAPSPFLHWIWFDCFWAEMLPRGAPAAVVTVWRDGSLIGAAPVCVTTSRLGPLAFPLVTGMENAHSPSYTWLLSADAQTADLAAGEIVGAVRDLGGPNAGVTWGNAPRHCAATDAARESLARAGLRVVWRPGRPHRVVNFADGAEALLATFSSNMRAKLRKSARRLARMGEVRFDEVSARPDLDAQLAAAWELEARGWKGRAGTAVAHDERLRRFYNSVATGLASEQRFRLFTLACGDRTVAFLYGLVEGDRLHGLKFSYDPDFAWASPGHVILWRIIEHIEDSGVIILDLGRDSDFKAHWNGELVETGAIYGIARGGRGALAMLARKGWAPLLRRLKVGRVKRDFFEHEG